MKLSKVRTRKTQANQLARKDEEVPKGPMRGLRTFGLAMTIVFAFAAYSQARVQIIDRDKTIAAAQKNNQFERLEIDKSKRGRILARDGKILARDQETFELRVDFRTVPTSPAFFTELSAVTGISVAEFETQLAAGAKVQSWPRALNVASAKELIKFKARWLVDGIDFARVTTREYPLQEYAFSVVGLSHPDLKNKSGLELGENEILSGTDGKTIGLQDRQGRFLPMLRSEASVERIDGKDVVLTLDEKLQVEATRAIKAAVVLHKADSGTAIIQDPVTGDVLAMGTWPSFDPTPKDGSVPYLVKGFERNSATMTVLEPGSTFKILTLAEAIEKGKAGERSVIKCPGEISVGGGGQWKVRCDEHNGTRAHGSIDSVKAIAKSCNVSAARWALSINKGEFSNFMERLGMFEKANVGLPGTAGSVYQRKPYAQRLQQAEWGFGQSIAVSPLALCSAFSSLANNGIRMKPRLIQSVGGVQMPPSIAGKVFSSEVANAVLRISESVIETDGGTGETLRIPHYRLAGKTGTAQKIGMGKGYVSSFVGYVPAVKPRAVILVMVDNPRTGGYYGSTVAGPVFKQLAKAVIDRLNIPPTK